MELIYLIKGETVLYNNIKSVIIKIIDIETVTIEECDSGIFHTVKSSVLDVYNKNLDTENHLHSLTEKEEEKVNFRYGIIKDLVENTRNIDLVNKKSLETGISVPTIYRWIKLYNKTGLRSSLAGTKRTGGVGKSRLLKPQDEIIDNVINSVYLNSSRKSIIKTIREIQIKCKDIGIDPPHPNTVRNRIKNISDEEKVKKRFGIKEAKYMFEPHKGQFPNADYPLSIIQIDHTLVDIILVDEQYRKAFRRPWITVAIDVYSRMVVGFHLSFDSPSSLGVGICISNAILPKEIWLENIGVTANWPCWGIMDTIHLDNAKEFHSKSLKKVCQEYNISIDYRPVKTPHFGGHIERLMGTFSKEIHNLPGTTFSNIKERDNYNSKKNASFTLSEFEVWITTYITKIYHQREHSSIGMAPINKYQEGLFGENSTICKGIPPRIINETKTRIDFLPYEERTIQEYGVVIDHIYYYDDVLRNYIHSKNAKGLKQNYIFKRDPRDISKVYFFDPNVKEYYPIPYRNTSFPPISIWEYRHVLETIKKNKKIVDENSIFETYKDLNELESSAIMLTKKKLKQYKSNTNNFLDKPTDLNTINYLMNDIDISSEEIKPFEEID